MRGGEICGRLQLVINQDVSIGHIGPAIAAHKRTGSWLTERSFVQVIEVWTSVDIQTATLISDVIQQLERGSRAHVIYHHK